MRKHPAGKGDSGKDSPCLSIRRMRMRGRRRVRRRRSNLKSFSRDPDVPEEVTPVNSNCRLQVLRSKETPSESRYPDSKGKDDIVEDSWPPIQGAVSDDLFVMAARTASTAKLKMPGSSLETAMEDVHVPATRNSLAWESVGRGQLLGAAPNLEYPRSGVQTKVADTLEMPSSPSGLCRPCLVDQM